MSEHKFGSPGGEVGGPEAEMMAAAVRASARLETVRLERLRAIVAVDSTEAYRFDGFTSTASFLVDRCRLGVRQAHRELALARSLPHLAYAVKLADQGDLSVAQLELLSFARNRHPQPFAADEPTLSEAASGLTYSDTRRLLDYWAQAHDQPPGEEEEPPAVYLSKTWQGRGRLDGDLDPETYTIVSTALDTLITELVRTTPASDLPPTSRLRAMALAEMARRHLDSPHTPTDHGNRPHLTVIVDWNILGGNTREGTCELGDGTVITPETAQRLACDAQVARLLTGPNSEILDLGRSRRTASPAQWKAMRVRDRHCRFPGCRRPWSWCDAHHITPWPKNGPTNHNHMLLLCRAHHTLIHQGHWTLTGTATNHTFTRPNGTELIRPPP